MKSLHSEMGTINSLLRWRETNLSDQLETGIGAESITQPSVFGRLLKIFAPAPAVPIKSTDPAEVSKQYRYWQKRVLLSSIIGYATFYFVRANLPLAMPFMELNRDRKSVV